MTVPSIARQATADLIADTDRIKLRAMAEDIAYGAAKETIEYMDTDEVRKLLLGVFQDAYCALTEPDNKAGMHDSLVDIFVIMQRTEDKIVHNNAESRFLERLERTGRFFK